jgi:hypothetical protein
MIWARIFLDLSWHLPQCSIVAPVGIVPNVLVSDIGGWHGVHVATAVFAYERFAE